MSFYHRAKTKVRVESEVSGEFLKQVGVHQGFVLSLLLFTFTLHVITKNGKEGLIN